MKIFSFVLYEHGQTESPEIYATAAGELSLFSQPVFVRTDVVEWYAFVRAVYQCILVLQSCSLSLYLYLCLRGLLFPVRSERAPQKG